MLTSVVTQFLLTRVKQSKQTKQMSLSSSASVTTKQVEALVNKTSSAKKGLDSDGFLQGWKLGTEYKFIFFLSKKKNTALRDQ